MQPRTPLFALCVAAGLAIAAPAAADPVADFYRGKTISIYVAAEGGSYTIHTQTIAAHLGRFMPGGPTVIAQYMPGAGGAKAANYLYNAAAKDGTAIGLLLKYVAVEQAIGRPAVKYDVRKFNWLMSVAPINSVLAIWHKSPATTIEGAKSVELVVGSTGKSSETYITPTLMNRFLGTKFRVVTGYKSPSVVHVTMEQGETHGVAASFESLVANRPQWLKTKEAALLAQSGLYRDVDMPDVPTLVELSRNAEQRAVFEFVGAGSTIGRVFAAPPGVPQPRVAALRKAFDDMVKDKTFLAEANTRKMGIAPRNGAEIEALMMKTINASADIIAKTKEALR